MSAQVHGWDSVSSRAHRLIKPALPYVQALISNLNNQYHPQNNPDGKILLAVAENKLCKEVLQPKILQCSSAESLSQHSDILMNYTSSYGLPMFRSQLANFLSHYMFNGVEIDSNNIVIGSGCLSTLIALSMLLFEENDSVLIPVPYYPAFDNDFQHFGHVHTMPIHGEISSEDINSRPFGRITRKSLEDAYANAMDHNKPPKAILITNPSNPLGSLYSKEELLTIIDYCQTNRIHLIADEIYCLSLFNKDPGYDSNTPGCGEFTSVVNLVNNDLGEYIHWVWSFSKDFASSGLRLGVIYTQNKALLAALGSTIEPMEVSNLVQLTFYHFIQDRTFIDSYLKINASRLYQSYTLLKTKLELLSIPVLPSDGAIFAYCDFRKYLKEDSFEAEQELFHRLFQDCNVLMTPGESCHCPKPGYFRVCYAFVPYEYLLVALEKLGNYLSQTTH